MHERDGADDEKELHASRSLVRDQFERLGQIPHELRRMHQHDGQNGEPSQSVDPIKVLRLAAG